MDDVEYQGPGHVQEGSEVSVRCILPLHRFASWRRGGAGTTPITPDPWNRFRLDHGRREPLSDHGVSTLTILEAQANHSGDYFCSSFSPLFHSITVLPRGTLGRHVARLRGPESPRKEKPGLHGSDVR